MPALYSFAKWYNDKEFYKWWLTVIIDELLIALGFKADTKAVEKFDDALDDVTKSADQTEGAMTRAYEATDGFVSSIEAAMGIVGFFTGVLGGAWAMFHGTIMELEDLIKEEKLLTEVTKKQLEQQKKYKESVETLGKRFQSLKVELAFGFLPTMQKMIDSLDKFLKVNKDAIVNGILAFLKAITSVMGAIGNFARFIDMIVTKTIGWKATLMILGAAFLWLKRAAILAFVTSPLGLFLLALGAIVLLVDDFMTYMEGGESLFGDFWGAMIGWVKENKETLLALKDTAIAVFEAIKEFFFTSIEALKNIIGGLGEYIGALVAFIVGIFTGNTDLIIDAWWGMVKAVFKIMEGLGVFILGVVDLILKTFGTSLSEIKDYFVEKFESIMDWLNFWYVTLKVWAGTLASIFTDKLESIKNAIIAPFAAAFDWIANKFGTLGGIISAAVGGAKGLFSGGINANVNMGDRQAAGVGANNSRVVNSTNTTNASFIVNGAGNPNAIVNGMDKKLKSTQSNMGGAAKA